jgi:hypothetical protein
VRLAISSTAPFALALMMENIGVEWSLSVAALLGTIAVGAFFAITRLIHLFDRPKPILSGQ